MRVFLAAISWATASSNDKTACVACQMLMAGLGCGRRALSVGSSIAERFVCCEQWTNVSKDFKGTLDYIFYTHESLVPVALLELPEDSTVQKTKNSGLPNEHWSSDHIALMAEFAYRQQR